MVPQKVMYGLRPALCTFLFGESHFNSSLLLALGLFFQESEKSDEGLGFNYLLNVHFSNISR